LKIEALFRQLIVYTAETKNIYKYKTLIIVKSINSLLRSDFKMN